MILIAFLQAQNCTNHVSSWRHPLSRTDCWSPDYYQHIGRVLEHGKFEPALDLAKEWEKAMSGGLKEGTLPHDSFRRFRGPIGKLSLSAVTCADNELSWSVLSPAEAGWK